MEGGEARLDLGLRAEVLQRLELRAVVTFAFIVFAFTSFWFAGFNSSASYATLVLPPVIWMPNTGCA